MSHEKITTGRGEGGRVSEIEIVDVVAVRSAFTDRDRYFIVANRHPQWIYKREGRRFTAQDGPFFRFLQGDGGKGDAFAGSVFDIALDDGSTFTCNGNVWDSCAPEGFPEVVSVGVNDQSGLDKCYVFCSACILKSALEAWLSVNTPCRNYYRYDKQYTKEWADANLRSWGRPVSAKRARTLRRTGRHPWKDGDQWKWSPAYESRLSEIQAMEDRPNG